MNHVVKQGNKENKTLRIAGISSNFRFIPFSPKFNETIKTQWIKCNRIWKMKNPKEEDVGVRKEAMKENENTKEFGKGVRHWNRE